jgi:CDP-diacylglycerol--glycerol-3-phosphate 3-phosphatidyltransferase
VAELSVVRKIFNLPNRITLARLLLSLGLFVILVSIQAGQVDPHGAWGWVAFFVFVSAAASDWVDGWLARKLGLVTVFGRIMDPFVDKVVVCGSFVLLAALHPGSVPPWMVVVIVGREFFVNSIRGFMESRGISFAAETPGKVKMVLQCLAIGGVLFHMAVGDPRRQHPEWLAWLVLVLMWAALLSTVHSGWFYARKAFARFAELES